MSDVVTAFSELMDYRARLDDIAQRMESVKTAWSRLGVIDTDGTFGILQASAEHLDVPLRCQPAQRALVHAMESYHTAMERLDWAKATNSPSELEAAWGYVTDGDVLLALAIELAHET